MKTKLLLTALAFFAMTTIGFSQNQQQQNQSAGNRVIALHGWMRTKTGYATIMKTGPRDRGEGTVTVIAAGGTRVSPGKG